MEPQASKIDSMLVLARSRAPGDRERLLLAMADLCNGAETLTGPSRTLVQDIFMDLVVEAERSIRQRLAEKLARAPWAPHALISILALDDIEIARPVIAQSPMLEDADLVRLLVEAALEHQIEIAQRPGIGAPVVSAILDQSQPAVMTALAANETAEVGPLHMRRMVIASRRIAGMRGALARHPRLTGDLAETLYGWVGETLRAAIAERFTIDRAKLAATLTETVAELMAGPAEPVASPTAADEAREQAEMERRLTAKLEAAGQLRPGYLLRALREGRRSLFEIALATLGGYQASDIAKIIACDRADLLALACAGVGLDRSVFPTILSLTQDLNHGHPVSRNDGRAAMMAAFAMAPADAANAFRASAAVI